MAEQCDVTKELKKLFDSGLQSTSGPHHKDIAAAASQLQISTQRVKVWS